VTKCFGDLIESYEIGAVRVVVRYGCAQRDQYELRVQGALPARLKETLAGSGHLRGSDLLYVIEIEGVHQITVAPAQGRIVVMPRLACDRASQRRAADDLATLVDRIVSTH
jgi:hypothetical protein